MKHFLWAFLLAVVLYVVFYAGIESRRTRRGPWEVAFTNDPAGEPFLLVNQLQVGVTNVAIAFPGEILPGTNRAAVVTFEVPRAVPYDLPFGTCIFMDITFLPGSVTFSLFGHQVELMPKRLILDGQEQAWEAGKRFALERPPRSGADH